MYVIKIDATEKVAYINAKDCTIDSDIAHATKCKRKIEAETCLFKLDRSQLQSACNVWKKRYNIANSFYIKVEEIHEEKPESIIISHKSDPIPPEPKINIDAFEKVIYKEVCFPWQPVLFCDLLDMQGKTKCFIQEIIPYNDETKHLCYTELSCPDKYKNYINKLNL